MCVTKITNEYDNNTSSSYTDYDNITSSNYTEYYNMTLSICKNIENEDINIIFKNLLLSIRSSISKFSLISLMVYTLIKHLFIKN